MLKSFMPGDNTGVFQKPQDIQTKYAFGWGFGFHTILRSLTIFQCSCSMF